MFSVDVLFTITPIQEHQLEQKDYIIPCCRDEGMLCAGLLACLVLTALLPGEINWNPLGKGKGVEKEIFIEFWENKSHKDSPFPLDFNLF